MKKSPPLSLTQKAVRALNEAVAQVIDDHRRQGRPLAVWRGGKAVWLPLSAVGTAQESAAPYAQKPRSRSSRR